MSGRIVFTQWQLPGDAPRYSGGTAPDFPPSWWVTGFPMLTERCAPFTCALPFGASTLPWKVPPCEMLPSRKRVSYLLQPP